MARITYETVFCGHTPPDAGTQIRIKINRMNALPFLGVDVSRDELVIFDQADSSVSARPNSGAAIAQICQERGWQPQTRAVALESTGHVSFLPMQHFVRAGFTVRLLNPIITKRFTRATVRMKKTDRSDAEAIAIMAREGEGREITEKDLEIAKKTLLRLEHKLTDMASDLKRMKKALGFKLDSGLELAAAEAAIDELIDQAEKAAGDIWKLAKKEGVDRQEEIIASHIGCGEKLSAIISAEAGDLKRFPTARQFKAYAGIDPKVIQSGVKDARGPMSKRGNPNLRRALYLASFVASNHDPELSAYYRRKREEGKPHVLAVCAVARKMCERIHATVTQDRLYAPRYPEGQLT